MGIFFLVLLFWFSALLLFIVHGVTRSRRSFKQKYNEPLIGRDVAFEYKLTHDQRRQYEGVITGTYISDIGKYIVCEIEPDRTQLTFNISNVVSIEDFKYDASYSAEKARRWLDSQI